MDLYQLLNCPRTASTEQIQAEFRAIARASHPDKVTEKSNVIDFSLVTQARDVLVDSSLRRLYDTWLSSDQPISFQEFVRRKDQISASTHFSFDSIHSPNMLQPEEPVKPWRRGKQQQQQQQQQQHSTCLLAQFRENKI